MHFGFEPDLPYVLYVSSILAFFLTVFWRPVIGIYFLLPLIPLQTLRYRLNDLPLGQSIVGVMLLAVVLGLWWRGQSVLPRTPWTRFLCAYAIFTFLSLCLGSFYLGRSLPWPGDSRFSDWQGYITMPAILLLVAAVEPTSRQMKAMVILMCLAAVALDRNFWDVVAGRDFSSFSYDLRDEGAMGYAGVNGLGAFEAQIAILLLALGAFERKRLWQFGYVALAIVSAICLMYTFSRGGYLALLFGWLFLGLVKQRKLLVLLALFVGMWTSLVPPAVQQRVLMTYDQTSGELDHSAATRVNLWHEAMQVFDTNPLVGVGFDTYAYTEHLNNYKDTHNIYVKVLVETGVLGLFIFLWLFAKTFVTSYGLFRTAKDPFLASLGLGLAGWVVCSFVANCFGDRWMYLQVNGYMWVLGGLVSRALVLEENAGTASIEDQSAVSVPGAAQEVPQPAGVM
jgi:putative inorganic carbon (HCO3(-)) transporter